MATACIRKTVGSVRAHCGEEIKYDHFAFDDAERAFELYDAKKVNNPSYSRLWACPKCIIEIAKIKASSENK